MMRRAFLILAMAAALTACDDNNTPTAPADPNVVVFRATLLSSEEVPAVTNEEAGARGNVIITFHLQRDSSNNISGASVDFLVNLNSFPTSATWHLAHIHEGAQGVAGPVRVNTGISPTTAIPLTTGSVTGQTFTGIQVTNVALINSIIANPAGFYFNAHTLANPTGAVRGQLAKQ
jgi:hypothetical protein